MDDLNDLLIFAEVVRTGSITKAGQTLGMPKATVSRRLSTLENRLGARLLDKTTRRLELTEVGDAYFERCLPLLEEIEDLRDFASQLTARPRGRLRITAPPDTAPHWLAAPIASFCALYPEVTLEVDLSARYVDLVAERVDVAIRAGHLHDSTLIARKYVDLTRGLYAGPGYLARAGTPAEPADLAQHQFVLLQSSRKLYTQETLLRGRQRVDVEMRGSIRANAMGMMCALALADAGIVPLPDDQAARHVEAGRLTRVLPDWHLPTHPIHLVMPSRRFVPRKTQAFVEHLLATAARSRDDGATTQDSGS